MIIGGRASNPAAALDRNTLHIRQEDTVPRIFDNLTSSTKLVPALRETLSVPNRADFCVGYFTTCGAGVT